MSEFRKARNGETAKYRFSPTDMYKCPIQLLKKKKEGIEYKYTEEVYDKFEKGNRIHNTEGIAREGARGNLGCEERMSLIHKSGKYMFNGYQDFNMLHPLVGEYIEDLKSCDRKAFYHFNNDPSNWSEKIQVSCYRWMRYVLHGYKTEHAIITKIDRDNPLNRISLEIDLFPVNYTEQFILNHPTVLKLTGTISQERFNQATELIIRGNRWVCRYCEDKKTCPLNKKLTAEEKRLKKEKKEKKEVFNKLLA